jgi:branched-chain amino acid transport system permease protein
LGRGTDTAGRLRSIAAVVVPALALLAFQLVCFPMPLGVMLQGVIIGLLGALVAVGMALVYRANRILNFTQVQLGLAPTVLVVSLVVYGGFNYFLATTIGLVASVLLGSVIELVVIRRFFNSPRLILTVATIGLAQLLAAGALFIPDIWGQQPTAAVIHVPISFTFSIFPLVFTADDVAALIIAPLALLAVTLLLRYSSIGIAIRASAERSDRAGMLGIPVKRLQTVVWALAGVLSFIGVFLQSGILGLPVGLDLSFTVLLAALAALVLGNLTELPTIGLAAIALGVLQQGVLWNHESDPGLVDPVLAAVVIVVLLARRVGSSRAESNAVSSWVTADEVRPVPHELRPLAEVRAVRWVGALVVAGAVLALPWLLRSNAGNQLKATAVLIFVMITISVVMLTGWAGQLTLGQMSFVAFGAATGAYATQTWHLDLSLALIIAGVVGAVVAMVVSIPTLRLRGVFPAVTTLAFAMATTSYLLNPEYFSWVPVNRVVRPKLWGTFNLNSESSFYYFCLICLVLVVLGVRGVRHSRTGRVLLALRENELAAQSFGINMARAKLTAFALSGFIAGIAGCLYVYLLQAFSPTVFGPDQSILVFTTAVVGGIGSLLGAALGAIYLEGGQWFLPGPQWQALVSSVGVLLVLMIVPGGLSDIAFRVRDGWLRWVATRRGIIVPSLLADSAVRPEPQDEAATAAAAAATATPDAEAALDRSARDLVTAHGGDHDSDHDGTATDPVAADPGDPDHAVTDAIRTVETTA